MVAEISAAEPSVLEMERIMKNMLSALRVKHSYVRLPWQTIKITKADLVNNEFIQYIFRRILVYPKFYEDRMECFNVEGP